MDFYTKLRAKKIDTIYHNYHRYNKMKVENHWFDPGRAKNEKSRCFHDHYYPLIDQMPSCVDTTSRNIDSLSISLRNLRSMVLPPSHRHVYIYSPFIVIDTLINQDGRMVPRVTIAISLVVERCVHRDCARDDCSWDDLTLFLLISVSDKEPAI